MRKLITLFVVIVAIATTQAQTNVPLTNADFTSGTTLGATGPWTKEVPGYTITQAGAAVLTIASSGVIGGELKLIGTSSATQTDVSLTTTPVDISTFGNTTTLLYSYQMKVGTITSQAAPYNVIIILTDVNGVNVTAACTGTAVVKVQGNFKTGTAGVYQTVSCQLTLKANDGTNVLSALDATFVSLKTDLGKMIGNNITCDNFVLTASGAAASTTVSAASNTSLSYEVGNGPSAESNFTVAGANLTNVIVVTPGPNLEISTTTGTGFASSPITLTQSGGTVATTTIYTRLIAGLAVGTGGNNPTRLITVSTATSGVPNKTIQFTASITPPPYTTIVSTPSNSALSYEAGFGPSTESTFTVSGAGLLTDITITPGSSIEVSTTSGTGFVGSTGSLTLTQSGGTVSTTTIYARLKAGFSPGGTGANAARTVTIANVEAGDKTVIFTGAVTGIAVSNPSSSALSYTQGAGPSAESSFSVSGSSLTADVLVTPGSNMEISTTTDTGFASTPITITQSLGAITSTTIYSRLIAGLAAAAYNDASTKVTASSTGFTSKEIQFVGSISAQTVSSSQNISALALPASGSVNITDGGELTIDQNTSSVTMSVSPLGKVTLPDNTTLTSSTITLQSSSSGTATFVDLNNSAPQTVSGTVQQYFTSERNWYTSSPITAGTAAGLNLGTSVQTYSEASKGWSTLAGSDALVNGKGYVSVATTGTGTTGTISFSGTLNSGTITVPVTRTESGSSIGFNLVANPYPSYLDWSLVAADPLNANIGTTMWFRTKTAENLYTFSTYNSSGNVATTNSASTTISKFIPPMQAFWIHVNSGTVSTNLTFKNSMRSHKDDSGNTFKAPKQNNQQLLRLQISNGTYSDEAVVYFNTDASNNFDKYDSQKMFESASALKPEIFTQTDNEKLVINGLNAIQYDVEIPLEYVAKQAGDYSISRTEMTNFEAGTRIILKDKLNANTETELSEGIAYNFSSDVTVSTTDRFSLIFRAPGTTTGVNNTEKLNGQIFVNAANQITIIASEKCNYAIYNTVGQKISNGLTSSNGTTTNLKLQTGMYVVKVSENGKEFTTRVIIK